MKKYVSYSELSSFYRDRDSYYRNYIVGEEMEENEALKVGKLIHEVLETDGDWQPQLKEMGWDNKQLIKTRQMLDKIQPKRFGEREAKMAASLDDIKLFGIFDLYDPVQRRIGDYKVTIQEDDKWLWHQKRVDFLEQFTFYALIYWVKTHSFFREMHIYALNPLKGTCRTYTTNRDRKSIEEMADKVKGFVDELKELGWWEKRLSLKDRQNLHIDPML